MLNGNLSGKKILLMGGVTPAADLINLAHRNHVFIGVTDYNDNTYVKKIADAAHTVDATDVEAVIALCKKEGYNGVISNFVDMLSPFVTRVAENLGFYVPYTEEQLRLSTDKKFFKETCLKYDVPVPKEYNIVSENDICKADIEYPVIVKPVDGSGSKGISSCYSQKELLAGYDKAMQASRAKNVIVEQYLPFDEINVTYIAQNGDIQLAAIHDRYFNETQEGVVRVPDLYIYPSRYTDIYIEKYNHLVINMLKELGIKNGSLFMQACVKEDHVYFYEAGMRLNGCKTYQILEVETGFNTFERLLNYSLTGSMGTHVTFNPKLSRWYATINVIGKPGARIHHFNGIRELESYPWLIHIARAYHEGEQIPSDSAGTLVQDTTRIHLYANTKEELIERINKTNELYKLIDMNGENIILKPHDTKSILENLDYSI